MSEMLGSPPPSSSSGEVEGELRSSSTKFKINVPPPLERMRTGDLTDSSAGVGEISRRLAMVIHGQEQLRYRLSEALRQGQELQTSRLSQMLDDQARQRAEMAEMAHQNRNLRAKLEEQVRVSHDLERKRIEDQLDYERQSFERLTTLADVTHQHRAELAEQTRAMEVLQRELTSEHKRRDSLQESVATGVQKASELRAELAEAQERAEELGELLDQHRQAGEARLAEVQALLDQSYHQIGILEIKAREAARRNEIDFEAAEASANEKPGFISRYLVRRRLRIARGAMQNQEWAKAERLLSTAALQVDKAIVWLQLGHARRELELYSGAASAYDRASQLAPQNGETRFWLGLCRQRSGDEEGATAAYRQALELAPALALKYEQLRRVELQGG